MPTWSLDRPPRFLVIEFQALQLLFDAHDVYEAWPLLSSITHTFFLPRTACAIDTAEAPGTQHSPEIAEDFTFVYLPLRVNRGTPQTVVALSSRQYCTTHGARPAFYLAVSLQQSTTANAIPYRCLRLPVSPSVTRQVTSSRMSAAYVRRLSNPCLCSTELIKHVRTNSNQTRPHHTRPNQTKQKKRKSENNRPPPPLQNLAESKTRPSPSKPSEDATITSLISNCPLTAIIGACFPLSRLGEDNKSRSDNTQESAHQPRCAAHLRLQLHLWPRPSNRNNSAHRHSQEKTGPLCKLQPLGQGNTV